MTDQTSTLRIDADATGVETGVAKAKRSIHSLGAAAREAGQAGASGLNQIGDGAQESSKKVESATKNTIASIQRQIAAMQAGGTSTRQYQESLAKLRGIDLNALKPHLDQLDAVSAKAKAAAQANQSLAEQFGSLKQNVAAMAGALVSGAFVAYTKSIIEAGDAMNDLSQRVGISVVDLAKYELAASQSGTSMEAIAKGIKGMAGNLVEHGAALKKAGIDATTADAAMQQLADVFQAMPDGLEKTTLATKMFGKSGMDLIPMLNLGSEGLKKAAEKSAKFAEQMAVLAPAADAFNDSMAEVGLATKTFAMTTLNQLMPTLQGLAGDFADNQSAGNELAKSLGNGLSTALEIVVLAVSDLSYVLKATGRELGALAAQYVAFMSLDFKAFSAIGDAVTEDAERARAELDKFQQRLVDFRTKAAEPVKTTYAQHAGVGYKAPASASTVLKAIGGDDKKAAITEYQRLNEEMAKTAALAAAELQFGPEMAASDKYRVETLEKLILAYQDSKISLSEYIDLEAKMTANEAAKRMADEAKAALKTAQDRQTLRQKEADAIAEFGRAQTDAYNAAVKGSQDALAAAQAEYDQYGMTKSQIAEITLLTLQSTQAKFADGTEGFNAAQKQIDAQRALIDILKKGEVREAAKLAADDWKKTADTIRDNLTDAFISAIDSGKSLFVNLRDAVVNMFKNMVLRPVVQGVMQPIAGAVTSSLFGSVANAATGQIATQGLFGSGGISQLGASIGSSISTSLSSFWTGLTGSGATAAGAAEMGLASAAAPNSFAFGQALASIPGWGWAAMGVAAVAALASGRGETRMGGQYGGVGTDLKLLGNPSGGEIGGEAAKTLTLTTQTAINDTLKKLGSQATLTGFVSGLESSKDGNGFVYGGGTLSSGANFGTLAGTTPGYLQHRGSKTAEQAMQEYVDTMRKSVLQALQAAADIPKTIAGQLKDVNIDALSGEALTALEASIQKTIADVDAFKVSMDLLPFEKLKALSFDAASGLIAAAGGLEALGTNLNAYYTNFYSAEEQRAQTIANINKTVGVAGFDAATATRESFRALVESQDLTTEAGQKTYAALLSVAGAFAGLTPAIESTTAAVKDLQSAAMAAVTKAIDAEKAAVTKAYDAQATAMQESLDKVSESVGKLKSLSEGLKSAVDTMLGMQDPALLRQNAQAQIKSWLAMARAGGALPMDGQIDKALGVVTQQSQNLFGSADAYYKDFYQTLNDVSALSDIAGGQLEAAQTTETLLKKQIDTAKAEFDTYIEYLDAQAEMAQQMYDTALGNVTATLSVADAITALREDLKPGSTTKAGSGVTTGSTVTPVGGGGGGFVVGGTEAGSAYGSATGSTGTYKPWVDNSAEAVAFRALKESDGADAYIASVLAQDAIRVALGGPERPLTKEIEDAMRDQWAGWVTAGIVRDRYSMAVGTNYVPYDGMQATLHEGEAVVPRAYNPAAGGGQSNEALIAEMRAVRAELAEIKRTNSNIADHTRSTDRTMTFVTQGGTAMQTSIPDGVLTL